MSINWSRYSIILDLDDTLYPEMDYQASGYRILVDTLCTHYGAIQFELQELVNQGGDVLHSLSEHIGIPELKESLLWIYRLHQPEIFLNPDAEAFLDTAQRKAVGVFILTDGRSISQRLKLKALGLDHLPVFISEEFANQKKPSIERFVKIQTLSPSEKYLYVGDNIKKDFLAPNKLGWLTAGLVPKSTSVHRETFLESYSFDFHPRYWVDKLTEIEDLL